MDPLPPLHTRTSRDTALRVIREIERNDKRHKEVYWGENFSAFQNNVCCHAIAIDL
jgi:hypothetical protein